MCGRGLYFRYDVRVMFEVGRGEGLSIDYCTEL